MTIDLAHIQDATSQAGEMFMRYARARNEVMIKHLMNRMYPYALWGKYTEQLSPEDQAWLASIDNS